MKINMKEWIASILGSEKRIAIPVMTHSGIELLGHTVYDAVTNGEIHARAVKLLAEKYPSAASSVIMDLTVEAEAFGAEIHYSKNEVPSVIGRLVSNWRKWRNCKFLHWRMEEYRSILKLID